MNIQEIAQKIMGTKRLETQNTAGSSTTTIIGTATADSSNGTAYLNLGDDVITDDGTTTVEVPTIGECREGDEVVVLLTGTDEAKAPTAVSAVGSGDRTRAEIEATQEMAESAKEVADATNQHFFADENGIHVTTEENDADTGPNFLANSLGLLLRIGTLIRTALTTAGLAFYDQEGDQRALFGEDIVLGNPDKTHFLINDNSIDMYDRNYTGVVSAFHAGYDDNALDGDGEPLRLPYYTLGERKEGSAIGGYSTAIGEDNTASGLLSVAIGDNNEATHNLSQVMGTNLKSGSWEQTVVGKYNEPIGSDGEHDRNIPFVVGCGFSEEDRANGFYIEDSIPHGRWGIIPQMNVLYTYGTQSGIKYPYDNTQGAITLNESADNYDVLEFIYMDDFGVQQSAKVYRRNYLNAERTFLNARVALTTTKIMYGADRAIHRGRVLTFTSTTSLNTLNENGYWTGFWHSQSGVNSGDRIRVLAVIGYRWSWLITN